MYIYITKLSLPSTIAVYGQPAREVSGFTRWPLLFSLRLVFSCRAVAMQCNAMQWREPSLYIPWVQKRCLVNSKLPIYYAGQQTRPSRSLVFVQVTLRKQTRTTFVDSYFTYVCTYIVDHTHKRPTAVGMKAGPDNTRNSTSTANGFVRLPEGVLPLLLPTAIFSLGLQSRFLCTTDA